MDELTHLFTERVNQLLDEATSLGKERGILFQVMRDPQMLHASSGAAVQTNETNQEIIYLDPARATEQMVAHELMHVILHRSAWPQMYSISLPEDKLAENIANTVDNILDQYIFDPRLADRGFELSDTRDWYVSQVEKWSQKEQEDPGLILHNAFIILEGLLYKSFYRRRIIRAHKWQHPRTLELAQAIERLIDPHGSRNKQTIRQSMIQILNYLDLWLSKQLKQQVRLGDRIGISPLFAEDQLYKPASAIVDLRSYPTVLLGRSAYIAALVLKSDQVRFRNIIALDAVSEPVPITQIREAWQMQSMRSFIASQGITKYSVV